MLNFSAIEQFWELTQHLKADEPLTDTIWNHFYNIEGNYQYCKKNISESDIIEYKKSLEIVFKPSHQHILKEELARKNDWVIKTNRYKEFENEFRSYSETLKTKDYLSLMYEQAYKHLPASMCKPDKDLIIHIIPIGADAAAHDNVIFLSLHILYFFDQYKSGAIAGHELHHVLREDFKSKRPIEQKHEGAIYFLEGILNEGTADLIDKEIVMNNNEHLPEELQWKNALISHNHHVIAKMDQLLKEAYISEDTNTISEDTVRTLILNTSGHIPGFYMAKAITKQGYYQEMISNISDPFYFFRLYNIAAKKEINAPLFSEESINYIKQLETYYN